ncbi:MAG: hypothetical protein C4525_11425 [Desulfarculus sp.]|nr:MAG: hypothetical protein C4525_11425 [Desulfarculus sp.]
MEAMSPHLTLVEPEERLSLSVAGSVLFYRRLSLGALAAIERQQARLLCPPEGGRPALWLPPQALQAAICGHVLLGWQGVCDGRGQEAAYTPESAGRLPAGVRRLLVSRAQRIHSSQGEPR